MYRQKIYKKHLILTAFVAVMTSYWLVDILFDQFIPRLNEWRLFFDFLFFVAQIIVVYIVWSSLKKQQELHNILVEERQKAEDEKNFTQAILSSMAEGVSIQDRSFRVIFQNDSHKQLVGRLCLGELCYQAYSAQEEVCSGCPVIQTFNDGLTHLQQKRLVRSEVERYIEIFSSPMFDKEGNVVAGIETVRDVTHRVLAEREIIKLNNELQQRSEELSAANHDLESFNYSLSHDLRSPLAQIETAIDLLSENIETHNMLSHDNDFFVKTIRNSSRRIDQMIQCMLDLSRIGRGDLCRSTVDLSELASQIIAALQQRDPERSVNVTIEPGMVVSADAFLAQIVLQNLLENAWKYTKRTITAEIEFGRLNHDLNNRSFYIRDNGAGFNPVYSTRIFMPFQRLHDAQEFPGDGIGLSTVYRIIKRHGGDIHALGEVGKGATFTFSFEPEFS